jgi:hypothetical protein
MIPLNTHGTTDITHMGKEECMQVFWWENQKDVGHLEDLDVSGRVTFGGILEK